MHTDTDTRYEGAIHTFRVAYDKWLWKLRITGSPYDQALTEDAIRAQANAISWASRA